MTSVIHFTPFAEIVFISTGNHYLGGSSGRSSGQWKTNEPRCVNVWDQGVTKKGWVDEGTGFKWKCVFFYPSKFLPSGGGGIQEAWTDLIRPTQTHDPLSWRVYPLKRKQTMDLGLGGGDQGVKREGLLGKIECSYGSKSSKGVRQQKKT